jgi:TolA-binding protein
MSDEKPTADQTVPYNRFAKKVAEAAELKDQITAMQKQVAELTQSSSQLEQWQTKYAELEATSSTRQAEFNTKETLYQRGITNADHMDLAQYRFKKSGADNFSEWLETGIKNDPILSSILGAPEPAPQVPQAEAAPEPAQVEATPLQATPAPFPTANNGTKPAPPARGDISLESVKNMTVEEKASIYPKLAEQWGFASVTLRK